MSYKQISVVKTLFRDVNVENLESYLLTCDCSVDGRNGMRKVFLGCLNCCQWKLTRGSAMLDTGAKVGGGLTSSLVSHAMLASLEGSRAYITDVLAFCIVSTRFQCIWFGELDC